MRGDTLKDLTNQRFGKWTVIRRLPNRKRALMWECLCDCGTIAEVHGTSLKSGTSTQCRNCRNSNPHHCTHGLTHHPLYRVWQRMKGCTTNPNHQDYEWYGGKGIRVYEEWFNDFVKFYEWSIANGYRHGLTIDRKDSNGHYEPSNCRWIPFKEQAVNKTTSVYLTHEGVTRTISEWSEVTGIKYNTLYNRFIKGLPSDKILSTESYAKGGRPIGIQSGRP